MNRIVGVIQLSINVYVFMLFINARSIGKINIATRERKDKRYCHSCINTQSGNIKYKCFVSMLSISSSDKLSYTL